MIFTILGIAICSAVLIQLGLFAAHSVSLMSYNRRQFAVSQELLEKQIESAVSRRKTIEEHGEADTWTGFREFIVDRLEKETSQCTSVYLKSLDGKPTVSFKPGQHLTFRLQVPGERKPLVRCYSLSNGPGKRSYRITVKAIPAPPHQGHLPAGKASTFINRQLMVGQRLEIKAPSGSFTLDEESTKPVVLLAGGIGITPMISMLEALIQLQSNRLVVLVHGVQNGADQPFKDYLKQVNDAHANIHVVNCYSHPSPMEKLGQDFHAAGFASVEILRHLLPDNQCQFYLCGPPPFMQSLYNGLLEWGVPESQINYEAFGPATIPKTSAVKSEQKTTAPDVSFDVRFALSNKTINWDSNSGSLLDFAEDNDIVIDSGCRAGSCGTCCTPLIHGQVKYPDGMEIQCEPGQCLVCIAKPEGSVELDA